jgi:opacity protein-like surface antigen
MHVTQSCVVSRSRVVEWPFSRQIRESLLSIAMLVFCSSEVIVAQAPPGHQALWGLRRRDPNQRGWTREASDSTSAPAYLTASFGGGISSPPTSEYKQGIAAAIAADLYPATLPLGVRFELTSTLFQPKDSDAESPSLTSVSIGALIPISGVRPRPDIWITGGISYLNAETSESSSGWRQGFTFGAGARISQSIAVEIRAHTSSGTTWIPLTVQFTP